MASVRFNLKDPNADISHIMLMYYIRPGQRLKYYTGQKISPKSWNFKSCRPRSGAQHKTLSLFLDKLEIITNELVLEFQIAGKTIFASTLKDHIYARLGRVKSSDQGTFIDYCEMLTHRRKQDPQFTKNTIKNYRLFIANLKKFSKRVDFDEISLPWFSRYTQHFFDRGCSINYVNNQVTKLKMFLRAAFDEDISQNQVYLKRAFTVKPIQTPKIYLNDQEIQKLYYHSYPNTYLRNAANLFCIGALTGLRFGDLRRIDFEKNVTIIDKQKCIRWRTEKTQNDVIIPVNDFLDEILSNQKIKIISHQKINAFIKKAGRLCGINQMVEKISYPSGKIKRELVPKYDLITIHTARRSFATNMFKKGIPAQSIMKMTGHKSEKTFLGYLNISLEENALLVSSQL